jgi:hypothetical protein
MKIVTFCFLSLVACGGGGSTDEPVDIDPGYTQTVVRFAPDGSSSVTTTPKGGLHASAIHQDTACTSSDLRLFDQENFAGNEICFVGGNGNMWLDLRSYCRIMRPPIGIVAPMCLATWAGGVRSYYAGFQDGDLSWLIVPNPCRESFGAYTAHPQVGTCAQHANELLLYYIGLGY